MNLPDHPDEEVVALAVMLERGQWAPHEVAHIKRQIYDRRSWVDAGLCYAGAQRWSRKLRAELDPFLRLRFDFKQGWTLERWHNERWNTVGVLGLTCIRQDLIAWLKTRDMQAVGAEEYLKRKRADAAKIRERNEQQSTDKVAAAVDSLSEKRVKNFLEVERARHTGETLVHHGEDLKFVEHVAEVQKTNPAPPEDMGPYCGNPGMNPKIYKRKTGGKHIRE